jgi:hypothetical protein
MGPWEVAIRFYKHIGTWMFTLRRKNEEGSFEWYSKYWESKDEAQKELERIEEC